MNQDKSQLVWCAKSDSWIFEPKDHSPAKMIPLFPLNIMKPQFITIQWSSSHHEKITILLVKASFTAAWRLHPRDFWMTWPQWMTSNRCLSSGDLSLPAPLGLVTTEMNRKIGIVTYYLDILWYIATITWKVFGYNHSIWYDHSWYRCDAYDLISNYGHIIYYDHIIYYG